MGANPRTKGQSGEREIADMLNGMIYTVMKELGYPEDECLKAFQTVQRNQNQSAVGGNDLTNCFGMSIEVKRQEQLNVNTWWAQTLASAERNNEMPVLMYRQNRKAWRFRTFVWLNLPGSAHVQVVAEFEEDSFRNWFKEWVRTKLLQGTELRI
jgi:hypothetical protein